MKAKGIDLKQYAAERIAEREVYPVWQKPRGFGDYDGVGLKWSEYSWKCEDKIAYEVAVEEILSIKVIVHRNSEKQISYMVKIESYRNNEVEYPFITDTVEQAFAIKDALDDMLACFASGERPGGDPIE
jgi:hypothetical protein